MRNYAKYCKLIFDNKKYQLNLTEAGSDDAHFLNKFISVISLASPLFIIYKIGELLYGHFALSFINLDIVTQILAATVVAFGFVIPLFESGKGFNAILKGLILKKRIKKFYKKMRNLELEKNNINFKRVSKQQKKLTKRFLAKLWKITKRNNKIKKKYDKILKSKGYVDGMHAFVNDNIDSLQEGVDKFIFHNKDLLLKLCPEYQEFIIERYNFRFDVILNEGNYYDEFIWSASHSKDIIVKNNCLYKGDKSNYLQELKELFQLEDLSQSKEDKIKTYEYQEKTSIEKVENKKTISAKELSRLMQEELNER